MNQDEVWEKLRAFVKEHKVKIICLPAPESEEILNKIGKNPKKCTDTLVWLIQNWNED